MISSRINTWILPIIEGIITNLLGFYWYILAEVARARLLQHVKPQTVNKQPQCDLVFPTLPLPTPPSPAPRTPMAQVKTAKGRYPKRQHRNVSCPSSIARVLLPPACSSRAAPVCCHHPPARIAPSTALPPFTGDTLSVILFAVLI